MEMEFHYRVELYIKLVLLDWDYHTKHLHITTFEDNLDQYMETSSIDIDGNTYTDIVDPRITNIMNMILNLHQN